MFDLIKKTILTGVGIATMTKDKVEELAKELTENGKMSEKEGKKFINELLKKSEEVKKDLEKRIEGVVRKTLEKLNIATKEDIDELIAKIKRLEQKVKRQSKG